MSVADQVYFLERVAVRLLMIHADRFAFAVTGEANVPGFSTDEETSPQKADLQEVLVGFISVEQSDRPDPSGVAGQAVDLLADTARTVGTNRIMVYPYAHLASLLAPPRVAFEVVNQVHEGLAARSGLEVHRAPFGFYKSFEIACKGHPLSELAKTLAPVAGDTDAPAPDAHESKAIAAEKTLHSEWRIYRPDGTYTSADEFDFADEDGLRLLLAYEREGTRAAEDAPPHIKLMREQELVGYEPASDAGNMRWYPKGILVKRLLEQHCTRIVVDYGAMEVETPIMYDYDHPGLAKYLDRFPARQYVVKSEDKSYFLRFAACFGQYMILHDMQASYRDLPVRLYELTHFSFRREQGGEVAGLRRLRAFTMPDMHSLVRDMAMAKSEFISQVRLCLRWLDDIGVQCVPAIRFVKSFVDEHPEFVQELMRVIDRPALVEVWDERFFYFVAKFEMNFIDTAQKAACLSTVQIDVENAERFDIDYVAEDGSRQRPLIMHTSVSGSVDRNIYAMLENQAMRVAGGAKAEWPVWLAPIQVRLVPVAEAHVAGALDLARSIPFRVDVDDRELKLGKKVREAEREWIPFTIVVGGRELSENASLTVRPRVGEQFEVTLEQLLARLREETADKPLL
ncbi:MAG: threonine--tRNA ligase, partial [Kibdelosporangium sp.]